MALNLEVGVGRRAVVEEQHGALAPGEELLEREDLPAVAQRVARQQPHLRERVEDDAAGLDALDLVEDGLRRLAQLHLRGVEDGVLRLRLQTLLGRISSCSVTPSSVQPCERATSASSSFVSESVT